MTQNRHHTQTGSLQGYGPKDTTELRNTAMPRYIISFDDGSMDHIPDEELPSVGEAAHKVLREAKAAGVWIFGGGIQRQPLVQPFGQA